MTARPPSERERERRAEAAEIARDRLGSAIRLVCGVLLIAFLLAKAL